MQRAAAGVAASHGRDGRRGFTLIELMVVIAIIVLAAGLMTPTITDFFKNRQLEGIRGHFGAAFNKARLNAVTRGRPVSVVFFREGVRVFDEKSKTFFEDYFNPDTAPAGDEKVWFELGFLDRKPSTVLKRYRDWEKTQKDLAEVEDVAAAGRVGGGTEKKPTYATYNVSGLPKVTYLRDGYLFFATGNDVPSSKFKEPIPELADIMIYQSGNPTVCFIDLRQTGQIRSRVEATKEARTKPVPAGEAAGEGDEVEATTAPSEVSEKGGEQ